MVDDPAHIDDMDWMRARLYGLMGALLSGPPASPLLQEIGRVSGDDTPLGEALNDLALAARRTDAARTEREYHALFIGVGRGELLPYASYYLTGFLHEKPLARLRQDMVALGIARADGHSDPEDHIASLCEMMGGLVAGAFQADLATQQRFFDRHVAPWAGRFFQDLRRAGAADFYRRVGALGQRFVEVETAAFALAA